MRRKLDAVPGGPPKKGIVVTKVPAALARAVNKLGGVAALARRLNISERALKLYLEGDHSIPDSLFLRVVDLIDDDPEAKKGTP